MSQHKFAYWVNKFREAGFEVRLTPILKYDLEFRELPEVETWQALIKGRGIVGIFGDHNARNKYIQDRFAADNEYCFDKVQKCPLVVKLPCDFDALMKHLKYLASSEGFDISTSYSYEENNPFPYEVD